MAAVDLVSTSGTGIVRSDTTSRKVATDKRTSFYPVRTCRLLYAFVVLRVSDYQFYEHLVRGQGTTLRDNE
jgi:hypothetical protein